MKKFENPVKIADNIAVGQGKPVLFAGPCAVESYDICIEIGNTVRDAAARYGFDYVFKASFDKANRTSLSSFRGPGIEKGLEMLAKVKEKFELPLLTDIHEAEQAAKAAEVVDVLQIPAFLCRQTDLLVAAAKTGKVIKIIKAQFLSGQDMFYPEKKVNDSGNAQIILTERGNIY